MQIGGGELVDLLHCQLLGSEGVGYSTEGEEEGEEVRISREQQTERERGNRTNTCQMENGECTKAQLSKEPAGLACIAGACNVTRSGINHTNL